MIGFASVTLRPYDVDSVIEYAIKSHAQCIEWGGDVHVKDIAAAKHVKDSCESNGIAICSYGSYYRLGSDDTDMWKRICEITSAMDTHRVRIWFGEKDSGDCTLADFENLVNDANEICDIADDYGITVSGECHPFTFNDSTDACLKILSAVNRKNFETYFQSLYLDIDSDIDRLSRTIPYVSAIHLSYSEMIKSQRFGKKDYNCCKKILNVADSMGFDGDILLEFVKNDKPGNLCIDMKRVFDTLAIQTD